MLVSIQSSVSHKSYEPLDRLVPIGLNIALVNMPCIPAERPSIQCGLLKALLVRQGHSVKTHYVNLHFAKYIGPLNYRKLADERWDSFVAEWLFGAEAFGPRADYDRYIAEFESSDRWDRMDSSVDELIELRDRKVPTFISQMLDDKGWDRYDLVGFTCTFDQKVPSLAMARRIKERYPHIKTVFGGATLDQDSAREFVTKLPYVDFVIVGEADVSLPLLAAQLAAGQEPNGVPGLTQKVCQGPPRSEPPEIVRDLNLLPDPDYDEYFETLALLGKEVLASRAPELPFQSARGCWWGAKHHCTFCSLKDEEMFYRSRTPEVVAAEIVRQARKYRQLQFTGCDSILDMRYIDSFLPMIKERAFDVSFFYEVKANLTRGQLSKLAHCGVKYIQPGIESFSTHVLQLMKKGTTKLLNIRILKWARYYGLQVAWNILAGFPGETVDDYEMQIALIPLLAHLQPPTGAYIIGLEKHAPYVVNNETWFRNRKPLAAYSYLYPANLIDISRIAQYFESEPDYSAGILETLDRLKSEVQAWNVAWQSPQRKPTLVYQRGPDWSRVIDRRSADTPKAYWLDEIETMVMEGCSDTAVGPQTIQRSVSEKVHRDVPLQTVHTICEELMERRLFVEEEGKYLSLALPIGPER